MTETPPASSRRRRPILPRHRGALTGPSLVALTAALLAGVLMLSVADDPAGDEATGSPQVATSLSDDKPLSVPGVGEPYNQRDRLLKRGKLIYDRYCVGCHGTDGKGDGPAAERLIVKPRDFTSGIYKFRSTDSGSLPMETDLHRTITRGLARVSMPAFPLLPEHDKVAVIEYIKAFYPKWEQEKVNRNIVFVPLAPDDLASPERVGRGRLVYLAMGCANCHGSDGAGTGATQSEYTDAWGNPQKAFNFTRGRLKSGDDPEDIYRVFHTGLRSIMPSFGGQTLAFVAQDGAEAQQRFMLEGEPESLESYFAQFPETVAEIGQMSPSQVEERARRNSWDLVAYILSLREGGGMATGKPASPAPAEPPEPEPEEDSFS